MTISSARRSFARRQHEIGDLFGILAENYCAAVRGYLRLELFQVIIEMLDGVPLHVVRVRPELLIVGAKIRRDRFAALFNQTARRSVNRELQLRVCQGRVDFFVEYGRHN